MWRSVVVQSEPFDLAAEWSHLRASVSGPTGAVAAFCGLVRDREGAVDIESLTLEHYPGMTEASIEKIVDQAALRWPIEGVRVIHRVGTLGPGDEIVLVLVASAHRAAAFEACEFVMDYLKTDAIFWKREVRDGATQWVESRAEDYERQAGWERPR